VSGVDLVDLDRGLAGGGETEDGEQGEETFHGRVMGWRVDAGKTDKVNSC
jgi:hypothetical protein